MKKFIYGALALASVASLASCSSDEPFGQQPNDGKVTFTVTMPGQNTRFAEGTTVDQLYYTVFQNGTKVLEGVEDWPTGSLSTTVTLQLVSNQSYDVVFFADTKAAETAGVYTYKPATADFTVTYSDKMINNDAYDAFVKKEAIVADGGEKKVLLYRPFAQVNIGSDDLGTDAVTTYGLGNFSSTLTIQPTNLLSGMNFLSGTTTPQAAAVTFSLENFSNLPGDKFPVDGTPEKPYKYIEMNYLLVPAAPETAAEDWSNLLDVTYTINGKGKGNVVNELNLSSMPTRQNYQTNIYGSLLTTQQKFDVTIVPAFDGYFNEPQEWSLGSTPVTPVNNVYTITSPQELKWVADQVNDGTESFEGKTIKLSNDIDISNQLWTPIGKMDDSNKGSNGKYIFKGIFDGDNHTVTGVNVVAKGEYACAGFIGRMGSGAIVQNLTLTDVNITSEHYAGAIAAYVYNNAWAPENKLTNLIQNCKVIGGTISSIPTINSNGDWDNGDKVGGIAGYVAQSGFSMYDCTVENLTITGYRHIASFVGNMNKTGNDSKDFGLARNTANNITLVQDLSHNYKNLLPGELVNPRMNYTGIPNPGQTTVNNINYVYKNYDNPDYNNGESTYVNLTNGYGNLTISNFNVGALGVIPIAGKTVTVENSNIDSKATSGNARIGLFVAPGKDAQGYSVIIRNNTLKNVDTNCLYIQGSGVEPNLISITGNKFLGWGARDIAGKTPYFAVKIYNVKNFSFAADKGETFANLPAAGQQFVRSFFTGGNTWVAPVAGQGVLAMGDGYLFFNNMPE